MNVLSIVGWTFTILQMLLIIGIVIMMIIGGRDLRKQKKFGWLSWGLFFGASYLLIMVVGQILSLVFYGQ